MYTIDFEDMDTLVNALDWPEHKERAVECNHNFIPLFSSWACRDCGIDKRDFEKKGKNG